MSQSDTARPLSQPMLDGLRDRDVRLRGRVRPYRTPLHLTAGAETERVEGDMVTGTFFEVLGLRAAHGRLFTADDDRTPSGHPVVVLGHSFFERRFGGDPSVVGRVVSVNSHPMTVVGVRPAASAESRSAPRPTSTCPSPCSARPSPPGATASAIGARAFS